MFLVRPGFQRGSAPQIEDFDSARLTPPGGGEVGDEILFALLYGRGALENSASRASGTPVTSKRGRSEWRRARPSQPQPKDSVKRSLTAPLGGVRRVRPRI